MRKGLASTIIISIFVAINLFIFVSIFMNVNLSDVWSNTDAGSLDNMGEMAIVAVLIMGAMVTFLYGWLLAIALTHVICLIFTLKNRKSPNRVIRILNVILDACNIFLIIGPVAKVFLF